jgi:hypothetical protein
MANLGTEMGTVQYPLIQYATEVGWTGFTHPQPLPSGRGVKSLPWREGI